MSDTQYMKPNVSTSLTSMRQMSFFFSASVNALRRSSVVDSSLMVRSSVVTPDFSRSAMMMEDDDVSEVER